MGSFLMDKHARFDPRNWNYVKEFPVSGITTLTGRWELVLKMIGDDEPIGVLYTYDTGLEALEDLCRLSVRLGMQEALEMIGEAYLTIRPEVVS